MPSPKDPPPPTTIDELHSFLTTRLEIDCPRQPLLPASSAPFEYLMHTYFEGYPPGSPRPAPGQGYCADAVVWANRGGGKTFYGAVATFLDLTFKPGIQVRILGGSLEQSERMYAHLRALFERPAMKHLVDGRITRKRIQLANGSAVEVLAQSQTAVRGTRVQKIRCDEVELFDHEIWQAAQLTTRSLHYGGPWGQWIRGSVEALSTMHQPYGLMWQIVGDSTSAGADGPGPDAASAPRKATRRLFRWGVIDVLALCPPEHECESCALHEECQGRAKHPLPEAPPRGKGEGSLGLPIIATRGHITIPDALALKARVDLATWRTEMLCLSPRRSETVFPEFDPDVHIYRDDLPHTQPPPGKLICGMDFGFRAPTVILWAAVTSPPDNTLRIFAERIVRQTRTEEHIQAITAGAGTPGGHGLPSPDWIGVDPAGNARSDQSGVSNVQLLRAAGLTVRHRKFPVQAGLSLIRARLAPADNSPPRLLIHARCTGLIEALQRYHYDENRPESIDPVKDGHDHAADALRYLITNLDAPYKTRPSRGW